MPSYPCGSSSVSRDVCPHFEEAGDEELVDHDLRAVDEVAVLRLPEDERVRRCNGIAVLEAEARVLGERRVVDLERRAGVGQRLDRRMRLPGALVVQNGMAVREGAALGVLAGEPDRNPLDQQARERERLRLAPVDPAVVQALAPALELLQQLLVALEALRQLQQLLVQRWRRSAGTAVTTAPPVSAGILPSFVGRGSANRCLQLLVRRTKLLLRLLEEPFASSSLSTPSATSWAA